MVFQQQLTKSLNKHQFAFYSFQVMQLLVNNLQKVYEITEIELVHRIVRVVKLSVNERFIVFDKKRNSTLKLMAYTKRSLTVQVLSVKENKQLQPYVVFLLPLLKKDALESSLYSLAEMGINEVQLVITAKSRQRLVSEKEFQRLHNILIAAAEQSKHYAFPELHFPKKICSFFNKLVPDNDKIIFDVTGSSFFEVRNKIIQDKIYLTVGPEGGFTSEELYEFKKHGFTVCALTQTILRALQAVVVGSALFRL